MKKKIKIKWPNLIVLIIGITFFIILIISIINIIIWKIDANKINSQINKVQENIMVEEIIDNENTEIIETQDKIDAKNPYWDYLKMNMINVNFDELKKTNPDVKGWIQVNGTNINYPFVQTKDNNYYLTHSFDKSYNTGGWVFLDYRNNDTDNKNTIIYAHGRSDKTMFGSLKNIIKSNWYSNSNNYVVKLSTEKENNLWQVFSIYQIKTTSDYIQTEFSNNNEYQIFLDTLKNRSVYNFNIILNENDKILTLSTCYNKTEKVVMHAKLIKKSLRE